MKELKGSEEIPGLAGLAELFGTVDKEDVAKINKATDAEKSVGARRFKKNKKANKLARTCRKANG